MADDVAGYAAKVESEGFRGYAKPAYLDRSWTRLVRIAHDIQVLISSFYLHGFPQEFSTDLNGTNISRS
jgi:hypothetical protein